MYSFMWLYLRGKSFDAVAYICETCWFIVHLHSPNMLIFIQQCRPTSFGVIPPHITLSEQHHSAHPFILRCLSYKSRFLFFSFPLALPHLLIKDLAFLACLYGHIQSWVSWNPPHPFFKSMQITTSKSSSASFETELCTCGDWKTEVWVCVRGWEGWVACTVLQFSLILSYVYVMLVFKRSHTFF